MKEKQLDAWVMMNCGDVNFMFQTFEDSSLNENAISKENINILINDSDLLLLKNNVRIIPITILNANNFKISSTPSDLKQINLSYHVYNSKNELLYKDGKRSPFETDIMPNSSLNTGLVIDCTQLHRGQIYFIDIDVVIEGQRWLEINKRVKLILI